MSDLIEIPSEHIAHRQKFKEFIQADAEPWHREHLGRLYALSETYNRQYFGGQLVPPYILLNEPAAPRALGCCGTVSGFGGRLQIRIRPPLLTGTHPAVTCGDNFSEGRLLFVDDVLLHEMIHQFQMEVLGVDERSYHGHGPTFRDKCNEIGVALGLPPIRICKPRGKDVDLPACSQWPHNVRPEGYYKGALRRDWQERSDPFDKLLCDVKRLFPKFTNQQRQQLADLIEQPKDVSSNGDSN